MSPLPDKSLFQAAAATEEQGAANYEIERAHQEVEAAIRRFQGGRHGAI